MTTTQARPAAIVDLRSRVRIICWLGWMHASTSPFDALNWQIDFDCRARRKKTKRTRPPQYPAQETVVDNVWRLVAWKNALHATRYICKNTTCK